MRPDKPVSGRPRPNEHADAFALLWHADRLSDALADYCEAMLPIVERLAAAGYTTAPAVMAQLRLAVKSTGGTPRRLTEALDALLEEEPAAPDADR